MIEKIIKRIAIFTMALMCFSSCENENNITSNAYVFRETVGIDTKLNTYISNEISSFNNIHTNGLYYKDEVIYDFDKLVKKIEDEANYGNYKLYTFSEVTLGLIWKGTDIKTEKLNLNPNIPAKVILSAEIEQDNIGGDPTRFTELYSKKLTDAGFVIKEENEYTYYREFDILADAEAELKKLENDSILDYAKAANYFISMEEMDYLGRIEIEYTLLDGTNAGLNGYSSSSAKNAVFEYNKVHSANIFTSDGYVLVTKTK